MGRYHDSCLLQDSSAVQLLNRLAALEHQYKGDTEAEAIIALTRQEIVFEEYSGEYGNEFFLLKNKE